MSFSRVFQSRIVARPSHRLYSTVPEPTAGGNNAGLVLGGIAAAGVGYYLYKQRQEAQKGTIEKNAEKLGVQAQEAFDKSKERYSDAKSEANLKYEETKAQGVAKAENAVDSAKQSAANAAELAKQKALDVQAAAGEKVKDAGERIKDATK
ncbi:hypothetical protein J3Q64DRAFT_1759659 [Phycomyces blakesleeanus]|uniref:Uncharacterized protein n=2 Tax=Phycomyces blakesleeanus TaxID=4837 RepID=A0A162ZMM4_PHYB8|nr:hypothetical protein PHYBLDRAFT_188877 [Phycomyces blakesleeanus NRRL 1555(-)]OAD67861.1 hypothetical protein PHYBLDRAFT_188877 [Phycomyces blakesleeanus NRRL 1555(-)]|eukprot:XP_018285901.1 hypothetical protein PHYBLDRAFT_188877 [Phycomyces blakesleeanus NRRL 1555(-)]